jgi:hypothetical protein
VPGSAGQYDRGSLIGWQQGAYALLGFTLGVRFLEINPKPAQKKQAF